MPKRKSPISPNVECLLAAGKLAEAGRAVGEEIQARRRHKRKRGDRRGYGIERKAEPWQPTTPRQFIRGGMAKIEEIAGSRARDAAIRAEREYWLPRLELWHAGSEEPMRLILAKEIKRLRRVLGIGPDPDQIRALMYTRGTVACAPDCRMTPRTFALTRRNA